MNDLMLEIIRLKNRFKPGSLSPAETHLFHTTLYDPDAFRAKIQNREQAGNTVPDNRLTDAAITDDIALLQLGFQHVEQKLFDKTDMN